MPQKCCWFKLFEWDEEMILDGNHFNDPHNGSEKVLHFMSLFYVEYDLTIFEGQTTSQPTMAKMTIGNPGFDSQFLGSTHPNFHIILWGHLGVSFIPLTKNPRETNR